MYAYSWSDTRCNSYTSKFWNISMMKQKSVYLASWLCYLKEPELLGGMAASRSRVRHAQDEPEKSFVGRRGCHTRIRSRGHKSQLEEAPNWLQMDDFGIRWGWRLVLLTPSFLSQLLHEITSVHKFLCAHSVPEPSWTVLIAMFFLPTVKLQLDKNRSWFLFVLDPPVPRRVCCLYYRLDEF